MFSNEFMRFLMNYQPSDCECKQSETVKEIEFKNNNGILAKVYITINQK